MEGIREAVGFQDRAVIEKLRERIAEVDDNLVNGLMSKHK